MSEKKKLLLDIFIIGVITLLIICISMKVWCMNLDVPSSTSGDNLLNYMIAKSIDQNGLKGFWFNSYIGSPETSTLIDTPFVDYTMFFEYLLSVNIFSSISKAIYIMYFISYPLAGITMYLLMRYMRVNRWAGITLSILYAVTPHHFIRGLGHSTLSNYYVLPLGVLLALLVLKEDFKEGMPQRYKNQISKKIMIAAAIVIVGFSNVYYSFFSMLLILIAVVYKIINTKSFYPLLRELRIFIYVALCFIIGVMPKLLYSLKFGENTVACARIPQEAEIFALKIIQMLMPPIYSRVEPLRNIANNYYMTGANINENYMASLGFVATIGFISACIWFIYQYASKERKKEKEHILLDYLAVAILILILYATAGGFGTIFSYVITPEIRCLTRSSIVIVTLSIAILGILSNIMLKKLKKIKFCMVLLMVFFISIYLDVPINADNWQEATVIADSVYKQFFNQIEETMQKDDSIYQLPMTEFPEVPTVHNMLDYSLLRGYAYTENLKWSYGGVKGRNNKAMELYVDDGMSESFIKGIKDNGFDGVYIDTDGYADNGKEIISFYQQQLETEPLISGDGKLYFYSLKD